MLRPFAVFACGAALAIIASEGLMRCLPVSMGLRNQAVTDESPIMRGAAHTAFTYSKDWNFRLYNHGRTNNFGFFSDRGYATDRASIALIGDSFIHAAAIPVEQHLSHRLEQHVQEPGKVPAYDFGWTGGSIADYLTMARWIQSSFRPQAMAFLMLENDVDDATLKMPGGSRFVVGADSKVSEQRSNWSPNNSFAARLAQRFHLYHYLQVNLGLFRWIEDHRRKDSTGSSKAAPDAARRKLLAGHFLDALARDIRLPRESLVLMIDADRPSIYGSTPPRERDIDVLAALAEQRGFPVLRLDAAFRDYYGKTRLRVDLTPIDGHWNATAYDMAAAQLAAVLQRARSPVSEAATAP